MGESVSGDFFDGVRLWVSDSSLRERLRIVFEGAEPKGAYQGIRNSLIRLTGASNPVRPRRGAIKRYS